MLKAKKTVLAVFVVNHYRKHVSLYNVLCHHIPVLAGKWRLGLRVEAQEHG
jgi:hypothetical protein